jgi:hypothetical protein
MGSTICPCYFVWLSSCITQVKIRMTISLTICLPFALVLGSLTVTEGGSLQCIIGTVIMTSSREPLWNHQLGGTTHHRLIPSLCYVKFMQERLYICPFLLCQHASYLSIGKSMVCYSALLYVGQ